MRVDRDSCRMRRCMDLGFLVDIEEASNKFTHEQRIENLIRIEHSFYEMLVAMCITKKDVQDLVAAWRIDKDPTKLIELFQDIQHRVESIVSDHCYDHCYKQ